MWRKQQLHAINSQIVFKSNWIIWFCHAKHVTKDISCFFFFLSLCSFNRYFHLLKLTSASAVNITMASLFILHTCLIPSWNMHVMSRLNFIIESDDSFSFNYISHPSGLCWAKFHSYQVSSERCYFFNFLYATISITLLWFRIVAKFMYTLRRRI